jgi:hypothetical protein
VKINNYEILISSPYDREYLVAEIWYNNDLVAEINQEKGSFEIEFYFGDNKTLSFSLNEFQEVIEKAKKHLIGSNG